MKQAITILGCTAVVAFLAGLVWWVGIVLEFEYPYKFTLMRVRSAISVSGKLASQMIKTDDADWSGDLHW